MIYFDSSTLVKRYLKEVGSDIVTGILNSERMVATSKLTYPEIFSAFMRKHRTGEIKKKTLYAAINRFENDRYHFFIIEFHDELLPRIKNLAEKYPLKGADTLHLSSALWLKQNSGEDVTFVASDLNLLKAAEVENLRIVNPREERWGQT